MSTVLAGAVLTVITASTNIFGSVTVNMQPTIFPTMESCVAYVKTQQTSNDAWVKTISDKPEKYVYDATKKFLFSGVAFSFECVKLD